MGKKNRIRQIRIPRSREFHEDSTKEEVYRYVESENAIQEAFRQTCIMMGQGKNCCLICGDKEDLVKIKFTNGAEQTLCNFCKNVQLNMR